MARNVSNEDPVEIPITSELDLHLFRPNEIGDLLEDYFRECQKRGIRQVRVIHGKGTGTLKKGVLAKLAQMPDLVASFSPAGAESGSWGATWVFLT